MTLQLFVERIVARARDARVDFGELSSDAIPGSLQSGGPGVAFFLYEAARLGGNDELLDAARRWCVEGREWAQHATRDDWRNFPRGFLIGETGLLYVEALLCAQSGDRKGVLLAAERLEVVSDCFDDIHWKFRPTDLYAGAGGVLCATRDLDARLPHEPEHNAAREVLARVRDRVTAALESAYATPRNIGPDDSLGFAHGIGGDLWALMAARGAGDKIVRTRLAELAAVREVDEEGFVYWRPSRSSMEHVKLATWCNGMPGHTLLWCEVARQTGDEESTELARLSAETSGILSGPNPTLCCGLAGQSIALQRYAEISGDVRFSRKAYKRLTRAIEIVEKMDLSQPLGLWQGTLGVALVALLRLHGETFFPCIEPLRRAPRLRRVQARTRVGISLGRSTDPVVVQATELLKR